MSFRWYGRAEIELLCLNNWESFEDNKRLLCSCVEKEENSVVRRLLQKDQSHLDRIQVQEVFHCLSRIKKSLNEQGFSVKRADRGEHQAHPCSVL